MQELLALGHILMFFDLILWKAFAVTTLKVSPGPLQCFSIGHAHKMLIATTVAELKLSRGLSIRVNIGAFRPRVQCAYQPH